MNQKIIWSIGHSTHSLDEFIAMLHSFAIEVLADIRSFPGSRKFPWFGKDELKISLPKYKITYVHLPQLGGRRKPVSNSHNTAWRVEAFRGYADYMETVNFHQAITELETLALKNKVAIMCSEAVWWRCHRSLVSDYLKSQGWLVLHIMNAKKAAEHPYTKPARIENGKLNYTRQSKLLF